MSQADGCRLSEKGNRRIDEIVHIPASVIAAVNGYAPGDEFNIAHTADFMRALTNAKLGLLEATLNIILRRLAPPVLEDWHSRAKELIYTDWLITAQEAFELGILNKVIAPEQLLEKAMKTAALIGKAGRRAVQVVKRQNNECILLECSHGGCLGN